MNKLSKSEKIDKKQEAEDKSWLANRPKSKHFDVGTFVLLNNRRGEVLDKHEGLGLLLVLFEGSDAPKLIRPNFMWRI